ncbi:MAG: rod shape-determining protein MreC [Chloroflexota bacterium]|nr:rod shape-determining protein MreC [Chloroflexota bacterium]
MVQSRDSRTTRRRAIIYALLVALCLLLLGASNTAPMMEIRQGLSFAVSPIQSALTGATRSVASIFSTISQIEQLRRDNQALATRVQQLEAETRRLESVGLQNEQLTRLLGVRASLDYETLAAEVIGRQISPTERIVVLDRGTEDGVAVGDPVLAGEGALIGSVMEAAANRSVVLLLNDTRSVVIGLIESSRATGEVDGRLSGPLAMINIPTTEAVVVGDRVVTAGLDLGDGIRSPFPRGLLIGRVVDVRTDPNTVVQTAMLQPAATLEKLEYALVITDFQSAPAEGLDDRPGEGLDASPDGSPWPLASGEPDEGAPSPEESSPEP